MGLMTFQYDINTEKNKNSAVSLWFFYMFEQDCYLTLRKKKKSFLWCCLCILVSIVKTMFENSERDQYWEQLGWIWIDRPSH